MSTSQNVVSWGRYERVTPGWRNRSARFRRRITRIAALEDRITTHDLLRALVDYLSEDELRQVAHRLGASYDRLSSRLIKARKARRVWRLVYEIGADQSRVTELLAACQEVRAEVPWQDYLMKPDAKWWPSGRVSEVVAALLDDVLGVPSEAYYKQYDGEVTDTGCYRWPMWSDSHAYQSDAGESEDEILAKVRHALAGKPVIAYKGDLMWTEVDATTASYIVAAPTTDQFDALRYEQTNGDNYDLHTEDLIGKLRTLDAGFGISVTGAGIAAVEFFLNRIPEDDEARKLGEWLLDLTPDIYEAPVAFPDGRIALWWD